MPMVEIFVSHSTQDKTLAQAFVELLREGIGVPGKAIFCTSLKGHGIPFGEDFNDYMKSQIQNPKLVFLLMTPSYVERPFCLMELGASWAKSLRAIPVVAPGVKFEFVNQTLGLKQAWDIQDESGLIDLRQIVRSEIKVEERDDHTWEKKRAAWKLALKKILKELATPISVPLADYEALKSATVAQAFEIDALQDLLDEANQKLDALKNLKDSAEVKAVLSEFSQGEDPEERFDHLMETVRNARPKEASNAVFKYLLLDYFDMATTINWYREDKEEFERAIQYKLLSRDEGYRPLWNGSKLKQLGSAIAAVVSFMQSEDGQELARTKQGDGDPMEPDDLGFWEWHLTI